MVTTGIFESVAYIALGFASAFFSLEAAWHFTTCKIHDKSITPEGAAFSFSLPL